LEHRRPLAGDRSAPQPANDLAVHDRCRYRVISAAPRRTVARSLSTESNRPDNSRLAIALATFRWPGRGPAEATLPRQTAGRAHRAAGPASGEEQGSVKLPIRLVTRPASPALRVSGQRRRRTRIARAAGESAPSDQIGAERCRDALCSSAGCGCVRRSSQTPAAMWTRYVWSPHCMGVKLTAIGLA